jgi:CHAD domain-containing protein
VGSSAAALDHVLMTMRVQLDAIRAHERGTRHGRQPEELHQMRSAVRRLRAILRAIRHVFDPNWREALRGELEWLTTALGTVRDLDVLRQYLRTELASHERGRPVSRGLLARLDAERTRAQEGLRTALDDPRYARLLDSIENAIEHPRLVAGDLSLPDIARREFRKLRKAVRALSRKPSPSELHTVRLKVKRARYAAELAQGMVGRRAERFAKKAKKVQDILGEHQDAVVAEERLSTLLLNGGRRPHQAAVAEWLAERQRARRQTARTAFTEQWPKLKRRGRKAWQ